MKVLVSLIISTALLYQSALGWVGRFNRFSPEMLSNMGYGSFGHYRQPGYQGYLVPSSSSLDESILENEESEELADPGYSCVGLRCSANEHCCSGTVCVDLDGPTIGTCLQPHGHKEGSICRRNSDCDSGLICSILEGVKTCQQPGEKKKQYNEDCGVSSECDITKGLCCQLLRRHRQAPRKACSYFRDPLVCVGPVATDMIKEYVQHTANEKRLTGREFNMKRD